MTNFAFMFITPCAEDCMYNTYNLSHLTIIFNRLVACKKGAVHVGYAVFCILLSIECWMVKNFFNLLEQFSASLKGFNISGN